MLLLIALSCLFSFGGLTLGQVVEPRIVGGFQLTINQAPYQVSIRQISQDNIQFGYGFFCGGSLISNNVVLTAAHCLYDQNKKLLAASALQVVGGNLVLTTRDNNTFVSAVSSVIVHESYKNGINFSYDIALLKLKTNATITANSTTKLISLPTKSYPVGSSCLISGWGTTSFQGSASYRLLGAYVPIHNATECNKPFYLNGAVGAGMFCAGFFTGGVDACQGDSGGPLACNNLLYGITSHGNECALERFPGVYTDVYYFREWILKNNSVSNFISLKMLFGTMVVICTYFSL